jgi:HEXXH motif-containing protein
VEAWVNSLRGAFGLVATYLPDLRSEMELYLSQIVPVGVLEEKHLSASFQEAIGTIYLTLHPHPMTMVEALIHEFQHNKLNALFETDEVLENAFFPLFQSPVRPDPRPLHGVLLAVHAFLPVARLYEEMIAKKHPLAEHASFRARLRDIVSINREGANVVLANGKPTRIGEGLLGEIRRLDQP